MILSKKTFWKLIVVANQASRQKTEKQVRQRNR